MKKILYLAFITILLATNAYSQPTGGPARIHTSTECNAAAYYADGTICQDTDDNKLYLGTGAAVVEIGMANADLTSLAAGGTANCLWGEKSDGSGIECKTTLSVSAIAMTGPISGKVPIITKSDSYTLGTDNAQEAYGYMVFMSGANKTLTLPAVVAGMSVCLYSTDAEIKRVDPNASDGIRLSAARDTDGDAIAVTAAIGAFVCLIADSADGWSVIGKSGTWAAE